MTSLLKEQDQKIAACGSSYRGGSAGGQYDVYPGQPLRFNFKVGLGQLVFVQLVLREHHLQVVAIGVQFHLGHLLGAADVMEQDREAQ